MRERCGVQNVVLFCPLVCPLVTGSVLVITCICDCCVVQALAIRPLLIFNFLPCPPLCPSLPPPLVLRGSRSGPSSTATSRATSSTPPARISCPCSPLTRLPLPRPLCLSPLPRPIPTGHMVLLTRLPLRTWWAPAPFPTPVPGRMALPTRRLPRSRCSPHGTCYPPIPWMSTMTPHLSPTTRVPLAPPTMTI